jgi:hypothetical protein
MDGESAELVDGRRSPRRGLDGTVVELRDSHDCKCGVFGCGWRNSKNGSRGNSTGIVAVVAILC